MQYRRSPMSTFKPQLEKLEERENPSFLLAGNAVSQMAQPLNALVADMSTKANQLHNFLNSGVQADNVTTQSQSFDFAVADLNLLVADLDAVKAISSTDQAFIKTVALAEFGTGDAQDLAVLIIGKNFGLQPLKPLTDPVDQANAIMSSDQMKNDISATDAFTLNGNPIDRYFTVGL